MGGQIGTLAEDHTMPPVGVDNRFKLVRHVVERFIP